MVTLSRSRREFSVSISEKVFWRVFLDLFGAIPTFIEMGWSLEMYWNTSADVKSITGFQKKNRIEDDESTTLQF
tara:strand:- start:28176 stop:28397 length:222 start_codon:yes stop_codon:yes gene_type:complete